MLRLLCAEADVNSHKLRSGFLKKKEDWDKLAAGLGRLAEAPIFIDDTPGLSITEMRALRQSMVWASLWWIISS